MNGSAQKALLDQIAASQPLGRSASEIERTIQWLQDEQAKLQREIEQIRDSRAK